MSPYQVVGIDPALTNVGLVVLHEPEPGRFVVVRRATIKTGPREPMIERLLTIREGVKAFLGDHTDWNCVAVEDPTGQVRTRTKGNNPRTIAITGLAVGVVMGVVLGFVSDPGFYDVDKWMPKVKTGNFEHIMKAPNMERYLLTRIRFPQRPSDIRATTHWPSVHEIMAAGVAKHHIDVSREAERAARMGGKP